MRRLLVLLLSCFSISAFAQQQSPKLLLEAAHCLATGKQDWLGLAHGKATELTLGYLVDTKSYAKRALYVVSYMGSRHQGLVFTILLEQRAGKYNFDIQNNAKFVRVARGGEYDGVSFVEPPLGGVGTQGNIASAVKQIERQRTFTISVADLLKRPASAQCESYADKK